MTPFDFKPVLCIDSKFRGYFADNAWTLVVGAGISKGVVPDWRDLATAVVRQAYGTSLSDEQIHKLFEESGWSLDSWIQAAANAFVTRGKTLEEFKEVLEQEIYSIVRAKAKGLGLESYLTVVLNDPARASRDRIIEVCEFLENTFPDCSIFQVARALSAVSKQGHVPRAVLTFNADTLLETYLVLADRREHYLGPGPYGHPPNTFVQVTRSGASSEGKIPIIHCHGALSPKPMLNHPHRDSRDRLVFLEREYLAMANRMGSWGESMFMQLAHTSKMAFVGLSMSDSNIRRWMRAAHEEMLTDLDSYGAADTANPPHIWIRRKPSDAGVEQLLLPALRHLGVRPGWIDTWGHLQDGLKNLAACS